MSILSDIYIAARTRSVGNASTEDMPVLVARRGTSIVFSEKLYGARQRVGRDASAVWRFSIRAANLDHADLSFSLQASGDDAWAFEHVIIWGTTGPVGDEIVIPLASSLDRRRGQYISTDASEGPSERKILTVGRDQDTTRAERIIVIAATAPYGDEFPSATAVPHPPMENHWYDSPTSSSSLTLQAGAPDRLLLSYTLPTLLGGSALREGRAALLVTDLAAPFSRDAVKDGRFTITIENVDKWVPAFFAVFGVGPETGTPRVLIPFVATTGDRLKVMSSMERGFHTMVLPTAKVLRAVSPHVVEPDDREGVLLSRAATAPEALVAQASANSTHAGVMP
jgi:hypothetical protein